MTASWTAAKGKPRRLRLCFPPLRTLLGCTRGRISFFPVLCMTGDPLGEQ